MPLPNDQTSPSNPMEILRTPLIRLQVESLKAQIYLKLENLQPTGSFKVRGSAKALANAKPELIKKGVWTASAGNMALALAWHARHLSIPCTAIVPHDAPEIKLKAITDLDANIIQIRFQDYQALQRAADPYQWLASNAPEVSKSLNNAYFIHPFNNPDVIAGNGAIGLEIVEDLPDVYAIFVPFGGGGLSVGIAAALSSQLRYSHVNVIACEVNTAAPLTASLSVGSPVEVPYQSSFISGIGAPFIFESMWPLASKLIRHSRVVALEQVASAIRLLAERCHVIAEGAGAVALAAALSSSIGNGKIACVISGGNIDSRIFSSILEGYVPV